MRHVNRVSRRDVLKLAAGAGAAAVAGCRTGPGPYGSGAVFLEHIGVCTGLGNHAVVTAGGCTYIEEGVQSLLAPARPREHFERNLAALEQASCPVCACNTFIPGAMKSVGPAADHEAVLAYAEIAFQRAREAGVDIIVFGSGGSRAIPEGFARARAETQFTELLARMAPLAERHGVTIAVEPLHRGETNFINSVREGAEIVDAAAHPNCRLLADLYHMAREDEDPEDIVHAGRRIVHTHVAEREARTPPGVKQDDFTPYLAALKRIGYSGRMSIECRWEDFAAQLPPAVAYLRAQIAQV